ACVGVEAVATSLGLALSNLVNVMNPSVIVLGGTFASVLELSADAIEAQLDVHAMSAARGMTTLRTPALGDDSSLLGAAELAFRPLLADPTNEVLRPVKAAG
ncbi:MAG: ROK family protein, partial [Actinobacteria bacterium]|nr:ROK family protein [Actinomycetota bacterium]